MAIPNPGAGASIAQMYAYILSQTAQSPLTVAKYILDNQNPKTSSNYYLQLAAFGVPGAIPTASGIPSSSLLKSVELTSAQWSTGMTNMFNLYVNGGGANATGAGTSTTYTGPGGSILSGAEAAEQAAVKLVSALTDPKTWLRIGEVVLGVVLVGVAISRITGASNPVSKAVKASPVGEVEKAVAKPVQNSSASKIAEVRAKESTDASQHKKAQEVSHAHNISHARAYGTETGKQAASTSTGKHAK